MRPQRLRQINAATYVDRLPGDVAPARRAQQLHGGSDVLRLAFAADQRMATARDDTTLAGVRRTRPADASRRYAIHRDAVAAEFDRERLGEPDQTGFRGHDMSAASSASVAGEAADVDDGAAAPGEHARNDGTATKKRTVEYHRHDETTVRQAHCSEDVVAPEGSVVDQDVDWTECAADLRHHSGDVGLVRHIPHDRARGAAQRLDLAYSGGSLVARGFRVHGDRGPLARKCQRNGTTDPPHAAGDKCNLPA